MSNKSVTTSHNTTTTKVDAAFVEFGRNLQRARDRLSWDRQHLLERIKKHLPQGVHENTIYNIEKGKVKAKRETIRVIKQIVGEALNCDYPWGDSGESLTKVSLGNYIKTSELVNRLDTALLNSSGLNIVPADSFLDIYLARMEHAEIKSTSEIETLLREREDVVLSLGKHFFRNRDLRTPFISRGACIGLLQILVICEKTSLQELKSFLAKHALIKTVKPELLARAIKGAFASAKKEVRLSG